MATSNIISVPKVLPSIFGVVLPASAVRIQNQSISGSTSAGLSVSNATVPANRYWLVRSMRLDTAEVGKEYQFYADDGATSHMAWHDPSGTTSLPAVANSSVGWVADGPGILLPPGWRVGIKILNGAGALAYNWQYVALELALDL